MALTKDGIDSVENDINELVLNVDNITDRVGQFQIALKNDSNYQIFISGTEIGKELNEKLEALVGIANNLSENELQDIIKVSNQFLELQKDLNK